MAFTNGKLDSRPAPPRKLSNRMLGFILWSTIVVLLIGSAAYVFWYKAHS